MPFLTELDAKFIRGEVGAVLLRDLIYQIPGGEGEERLIVAPIGFKTDFASVPRIISNIVPRVGILRDAAIIHDYLYRTEGDKGRFTRAQSDKVFCQAMKELGVPWWRRKLAWAGVRIGGWASWIKYTKAK